MVLALMLWLPKKVESHHMKWKERIVQGNVIILEAVVEVDIEEEEDQIVVANLDQDQEDIEGIVIEEKEDQALLQGHLLHHQVSHLKEDLQPEEIEGRSLKEVNQNDQNQEQDQDLIVKVKIKLLKIMERDQVAKMYLINLSQDQSQHLQKNQIINNDFDYLAIVIN